MKKLVLSLMAVTLLAVATINAEEAKAVIDFQTVSIPQLLDIYHKLSGLDLVTDSHVKDMNTKITLKTPAALSKDEAIKFLEQGLRDQAGIVITRLDDKRASVTYNDALPVAKPAP